MTPPDNHTHDFTSHPLVKVIDRNKAAAPLECLAESRLALDPLCLGVDVCEPDVEVLGPIGNQAPAQQHLVGFLEELDGAGCDLYLHQQALDRTTPAGRAMFQMLGVFSEFGRSIIRSRVKVGMTRARIDDIKSGKPIGQQPLARHKVEQIRAELQKGTGILKTARLTGVSAVQRIKREIAAVPS
jgi:Resolvase, N terminal domain